MKKVEAYRCEYCRYISEFQSEIKNHQESCVKNPINKSCITCLWYLCEGANSEDPCVLREILQKDSSGAVQVNINCAKWHNGTDIEELTVYQLLDVIGDIFCSSGEFKNALKRLLKKQEMSGFVYEEYLSSH